jgi:aryl-alcohol dehydrogenase-like predicted oxidoreductase
MSTGLSRNAIFKAVEGSLERLGTDYIDVLQIHRFDSTVPPEETMCALHDLVRAGMVRYIGASSMVGVLQGDISFLGLFMSCATYGSLRIYV